MIDAEVERLMVRRHFGKARNYRTARVSFSGFLASVLGVDDIGVERIDARLIERYARWLELRGVRRNTVSFYMRVLRAVYNRIARARTNPFASVYTVKRHISRDVVVQLARLNLRDNRGLAMARDLFLFSLLMRGMPFVDIAYMKMGDIRGNTLCYRRRKTGQMMRVRIEPQAWTIIRRYHVEGSAMVCTCRRMWRGTRGRAWRRSAVCRCTSSAPRWDTPLNVLQGFIWARSMIRSSTGLAERSGRN